ncbi:MAG: ATP-binding cassette domain-containing protein [Acidobacteria bacterium]|nr:ATP-binding cassette domain-containing protein [Acidobacteriota bacterium]
MTAPAVETAALSCAYGARLALDGATLSVARGEIFALLGPNGGGKTTLFRILATLLKPTSGSFRIDGLDPASDARAVRRKLGVVFQAPGLDRKLTVKENLALQGALLNMSGTGLTARIDELLGAFSIRDRAGDLVETLSGGLARRVEIAKALLAAPPVLLLDEPSTGLDPGARRDLTALLTQLAKGGTAVLLTTHLFDEADAAHRIGILDRGRLVALGAPAALKAEVGGDVVTVEAREDGGAPALAREISARFGAEAGKVAAVGKTVRVERPQAHTFVPALVEAFPGRFRSLTLGAPSLEDVFIDRTGRAFREADAEEPAGVPA